MTNSIISKEAIAKTLELDERRTQGVWRAILNYERQPIPTPADWYPSPMGVQMQDAGGFTIHKDANPANNAKFITHAPTMAQQVRELWEQNQELIGLMGDIETGLRDIDPEGGDVEMNQGIINLYLDAIKEARGE